MMKFTIYAKVLKEMIEKAATTIDKKSVLESLKRLYMQIDENETLRIWSSDLNHYVEIRNNSVYLTSPGIVGIDIDDIKIITKMTGEVTIEDVSTENERKINIICGKKTVSIPGYGNTDIFLPDMDDTEMKMLNVKENWLLDTITNLSTFTSDDGCSKMLMVFNFNTKDKRVEALDGRMIGMRSLESQTVYTVSDNRFDTVKLHKMCTPAFKKLLDKKSEREVIISQDKKYVKVEGDDFTYIIRRIDGEYFNVESSLNIPERFRYIANRENFLEVMKYNDDLIKTSKCDRGYVIMHTENNIMYSYINTGKYEALDELEVKENTMNDELYIGYNPKFLVDVFNIIDSDEPVCIGKDRVSPLIITGNEYSFLILPVYVNNSSSLMKFKEKLNKEVA
nr:MAG TPA: beta clamp protein [Bacteriophage sp.]